MSRRHFAWACFSKSHTLSRKFYDIDLCHVLTDSGLAWQAPLKMCETPLELLTDINMLFMIENVICGRISMICHRYAIAIITINPYTIIDYMENESPSCIMFWDANNAYGSDIFSTQILNILKNSVKCVSNILLHLKKCL